MEDDDQDKKHIGVRDECFARISEVVLIVLCTG